MMNFRLIDILTLHFSSFFVAAQVIKFWKIYTLIIIYWGTDQYFQIEKMILQNKFVFQGSKESPLPLPWRYCSRMLTKLKKYELIVLFCNAKLFLKRMIKCFCFLVLWEKLCKDVCVAFQILVPAIW